MKILKQFTKFSHTSWPANRIRRQHAKSCRRRVVESSKSNLFASESISLFAFKLTLEINFPKHFLLLRSAAESFCLTAKTCSDAKTSAKEIGSKSMNNSMAAERFLPIFSSNYLRPNRIDRRETLSSEVRHLIRAPAVDSIFN